MYSLPGFFLLMGPVLLQKSVNGLVNPCVFFYAFSPVPPYVDESILLFTALAAADVLPVRSLPILP